MKLANLGCGGQRPQGEHWWNVDNLHDVLKPVTPERAQLDSEPRYINADLRNGVPFPDNDLDGLVLAHCLEHFTLHDGVKLLKECHRVLKPGGVAMVSVPDASVFRRHHHEDTVENAERIFGEPIHLPDGETTFMGYAGFTHNHLQLFTEDSLWCCMTRGGFGIVNPLDVRVHLQCLDLCYPEFKLGDKGSAYELAQILNRLPFSLVMAGVKE